MTQIVLRIFLGLFDCSAYLGLHHIYKVQLQSVAAKDLPQLDIQTIARLVSWCQACFLYRLERTTGPDVMHHRLISSSKLSQSKTGGKNWDENGEENPEHIWEHNLEQNHFREEKKYLKNI